jgi:hypothetical protein
MAQAKRDLTNRQVQGHTIAMDAARTRLGQSERGVTRFLREHHISYLKVGTEFAISEAEFEAALEVVQGPVDNGIRQAARELVERARSEQGLPPKIKDPGVIGRVVALLQPVVED